MSSELELIQLQKEFTCLMDKMTLLIQYQASEIKRLESKLIEQTTAGLMIEKNGIFTRDNWVNSMHKEHEEKHEKNVALGKPMIQQMTDEQYQQVLKEKSEFTSEFKIKKSRKRVEKEVEEKQEVVIEQIERINPVVEHDDFEGLLDSDLEQHLQEESGDIENEYSGEELRENEEFQKENEIQVIPPSPERVLPALPVEEKVEEKVSPPKEKKSRKKTMDITTLISSIPSIIADQKTYFESLDMNSLKEICRHYKLKGFSKHTVKPDLITFLLDAKQSLEN